jgi:predicted transcriptional regulator
MMSDPRPDDLLRTIRPDPDAPPMTVESLEAKLPGFSRAAIEEALSMLCLTGVLGKEALPDGQTGYRYLCPERYRLVDASDVKQPGPDFGRR